MTTGVLPEEGTATGPPPPSGGTPSSTTAPRPGRGRGWRARAGSRLLPYALTLPAVVALAFGLGYPLYRLGVMSTQDFGLRQQFGAPPESVGLDNFSDIFGDAYFWEVLRRSLVFCLLAVVLTMGAG